MKHLFRLSICQSVLYPVMSVYLGTEKYADEITQLSKGTSTPTIIIPDQGDLCPSDRQQESSAHEDGVTPDTNALIIYTSGTTGRPKVCCDLYV